MLKKEQIESIKSKVHELNKVVSELDPAERSQVFEILKPFYLGEEETVESIDQSFRNDLRKYFKSIADSLYKIEQSLYKK